MCCLPETHHQRPAVACSKSRPVARHPDPGAAAAPARSADNRTSSAPGPPQQSPVQALGLPAMLVTVPEAGDSVQAANQTWWSAIEIPPNCSPPQPPEWPPGWLLPAEAPET